MPRRHSRAAGRDGTFFHVLVSVLIVMAIIGYRFVPHLSTCVRLVRCLKLSISCLDVFKNILPVFTPPSAIAAVTPMRMPSVPRVLSLLGLFIHRV